MSTVPTGWSYNPASAAQRWRTGLLALAGLGLSAGVLLMGRGVPSVLALLFGSGELGALAERPEAGANVLGWGLGLLLVLAGDWRRWSTAPRLVLVLGVVSVCLAALNLGLLTAGLILLPQLEWVYGVWALLSLLFIGAVQAEVLASLQYLKRTAPPAEQMWRWFAGGAPAGE
jgi:hypothetical protein